MPNYKVKFFPAHGIKLLKWTIFGDIDLLQLIHINPVVKNLNRSMHFTWCNISDFLIVHQSNKNE